MSCEARGPDMNKQICSSYTHKRGKNTDSDHSDDGNYENFPGYMIRKQACNRVVENHKDNIFQPNEETKRRKEGKENHQAKSA
eukprot:944655-Heterocapsa_arctica.AAC.1